MGGGVASTGRVESCLFGVTSVVVVMSVVVEVVFADVVGVALVVGVVDITSVGVTGDVVVVVFVVVVGATSLVVVVVVVVLVLVFGLGCTRTICGTLPFHSICTCACAWCAPFGVCCCWCCGGWRLGRLRCVGCGCRCCCGCCSVGSSPGMLQCSLVSQKAAHSALSWAISAAMS